MEFPELQVVKMTKAEVQSQLLQSLDDNDQVSFDQAIFAAKDLGEKGLKSVLNKEHKDREYKTLLQISLDKPFGLPYADALIKAGADIGKHKEGKNSAPIHTAGEKASVDLLQLLFNDPENRADVNRKTQDGLNLLHLLLAQLLELGHDEALDEEARAKENEVWSTDEDIWTGMKNVLACIKFVVELPDLEFDFNAAALKGVSAAPSSIAERNWKKMANLNTLQILCSFQQMNAKPVEDKLHEVLAEVVDALFEVRHVDPNATGLGLFGTLASLMAASRGYHLVLDAFRKVKSTNWTMKNRFDQSILHVTLKTGFYNKIIIHGEQPSGDLFFKTVEALFKDNVVHVMEGLVNQRDLYEDTPLHYAKLYPEQRISKLLLRHGAKIDRNAHHVINLRPAVVQEYFLEHCIVAEGDDVDDEDFTIRINFEHFSEPQVNDLQKFEWHIVSMFRKKKKGRESSRNGMVDAKRLTYYAANDNMHNILRHCLVTAFLEIQLNRLKQILFPEFCAYFIFVICLFLFLSNKYDISENFRQIDQRLYEDKSEGFVVSVSSLILCLLLAFLIAREMLQGYVRRKAYVCKPKNYLEW